MKYIKSQRPSMTKQHFDALAKVIQASSNELHLTVRERHILEFNIADMCQHFNPNFDRGRFYRAIGQVGQG